MPLANRSERIVEDALVEALGADYRQALAPLEPPVGRRSHLTLPLLLRDPDARTARDLRYAEGAGRRHLLDVYMPRARATTLRSYCRCTAPE